MDHHASGPCCVPMDEDGDVEWDGSEDIKLADIGVDRWDRAGESLKSGSIISRFKDEEGVGAGDAGAEVDENRRGIFVTIRRDTEP